MLTDEQVDELVRQVPFGREPYITFRAIFRAGMMKGARIAQDAERKLTYRTWELEEAEAEVEAETADKRIAALNERSVA